MDNEPNNKNPIYEQDLVSGLDFTKNTLKKIRHKEIKELGVKFNRNLELVTDLISLPHVLIALQLMKMALIPHDIVSGVKARLAMRQENVEESDWSKRFERMRKERYEQEIEPNKDKMIDEAINKGEKELLRLIEDSDPTFNLEESYSTLLYSTIVWTWCSFEMLMKELWELAVNKGGKFIGSTLIKGLTSSEEIEFPFRGKYINIEYLAKYEYDLSKRLGTALIKKFDFTSPSGIREAYSSVFPKSTSMKNSLTNSKIVELEAYRNVIVHNTGIIDEDYCVKTDTDKNQIGNKISVDSRKVCEFVSSTQDTGINILISVSSFLSKIKQNK